MQQLRALAVLAGNPLHNQTVDRILRFGTRNIQRDLLADHHLGQLALIGLCRIYRADILALAQHRNLIGQREHFMQLVRDNDDRLAAIAHSPEHRKEFFGLLRRQHSSRLIQDQNICAAVQHFQDLDGLLFRDRHLIDLLVRIDVKAVLHGDLHNFPCRLL